MKKTLKTLKPKKCKAPSCGKVFIPFSSLAKACCVACSIELTRELNKIKNAKEYNKETRRLKNDIKSRSDWIKDCQRVFNSYIRSRDIHERCISCGRAHDGQYHAGHYKTVGANPELRFDPDNCHKQCAPCNNHLSGNISNYRPNLLNKIGAASLERLEGYNEPKKYTIDDLKELKKFYQDKIKIINEG